MTIKGELKMENLRYEIRIIWHIDDVRRASDDRLNDDECRDVLQYLLDEHDASIGINWEVIEFAIEELFPKDENKEEQIND